MARVYGIGLQTEFAIRVFRMSLRMRCVYKCTCRFYWTFFRVDFADLVHGSILPVSLWVLFMDIWVGFTNRHYWSYFIGQI